jgi:FkbH-like protein
MFQLAWKNKYDKESSLTNLVKKNPPRKPPISHAAFLMWEEHCVECSPPDCYNNCALYVKREDQRCARFVNGILPIKNSLGGDGFSIYINFRRWAKLETPWPNNPRMYTYWQIRLITHIFNTMEGMTTLISRAFKSFSPDMYLNDVLLSLLHKAANRISNLKEKNHDVDGLYFQIYSMEFGIQIFQFEIHDSMGIRFREKLELKNGWNDFYIESNHLPKKLSGNSLARLWNDSDKEVKVIISWAHLLKFTSLKDNFNYLYGETLDKGDKKLIAKIKCVVFDLDNTLWDGVIGDEESSSSMKLLPNVIEFIKELDRRGILCSIASKNEFDIAWNKIKSLGLEGYFLYPQIHWNSKSESIKKISDSLNIGLDTLAFIDDSAFERGLVSNQLPEVRIYEKVDLEIFGLDEFKVEISDQSSKRRESYLVESQRNLNRSMKNLNLNDFLRSCKMEMLIDHAVNHFDRCYELIQRTNQFNISGKKYTSMEFRGLLSNKNSICWSVSDIYGNYGIVGLLIYEVSNDEILVEEFLMSCRVAAKSVEESLFNWLISTYKQIKHVKIIFTPTNRNQPIQHKFNEMGFYEKDKTSKGALLLESERGALYLKNPVISIKSIL